jgi:hypothetical protein
VEQRDRPERDRLIARDFEIERRNKLIYIDKILEV